MRKNKPSWVFKYDGHHRAFLYRSRYGNLYRINLVANQVEILDGKAWRTNNDTVRALKLFTYRDVT